MIKSLLCEILVLELINVKIERKLYSSWNKAFLFPLGIIADGMRDRKRYFKLKKETVKFSFLYLWACVITSERFTLSVCFEMRDENFKFLYDCFHFR